MAGLLWYTNCRTKKGRAWHPIRTGYQRIKGWRKTSWRCM